MHINELHDDYILTLSPCEMRAVYAALDCACDTLAVSCAEEENRYASSLLGMRHDISRALCAERSWATPNLQGARSK